MIDKGIHPSAVVDIKGEGTLPDTTIMEPLSVIYVGPRGKIDLGEMFILYPNASIRIDQGWFKCGREVSFSSGVHLYEPRDGIEIGDYVMIGGGTVLCSVNHGHADLAIPMRQQPAQPEKITIGNNVWIGMNCSILPGVTIGDGVIIGAGSVVTKDLPSNTICYGVPCEVRSRRGPGDEELMPTR